MLRGLVAFRVQDSRVRGNDGGGGMTAGGGGEEEARVIKIWPDTKGNQRLGTALGSRRLSPRRFARGRRRRGESLWAGTPDGDCMAVGDATARPVLL